MKITIAKWLVIVHTVAICSVGYCSEKKEQHNKELFETTLKNAAIIGDTETLLAHLDDIDDINALDHEHYTLLIRAAENGHTDTVVALLDNGAIASGRALLAASEKGHIEVVRTLLDRGADPDYDDDFDTPLIAAAGNGFSDIVDALIEHGADLNTEPIKGDGPALHVAARAGQTDVVFKLLKEGANVCTQSGDTVLIFAACNSKNVNLAKSLMDKGITKVNDKSKYGHTALMGAALWGGVDMVKMLINNGADVNAKDESGSTALMNAAYSIIGGVDVTELLIHEGADIHVIDSSGNSILMVAAKKCNADVVSLLIDKGLDVNHKNNKGETSLMLAADYDDSILKLTLLVIQDKYNKSNYPMTSELTLSDYAKQSNLSTEDDCITTLRILLDNGADINAVNNEGKNALDYAKIHSIEGVVQFLKQSGAKEL